VGAGTVYFFLDFDGVLHPDNCAATQHLCYAKHLAEVLDSVDPDQRIRVVFSTTWRTKYSVQVLKDKLPQALSRRVAGATPDHFERPGKYSRQREVEEWMDTNAPGDEWIAVDDWPENYDKPCPNLFVIPGFDAADGGGLTPPVAQRLRVALQAKLAGQRLQQ